MLNKLSIHSLLVAITLLTGCASEPKNEQIGIVIGSVIGNLIGSEIGSGRGRTAATIAGTAIGAMIGGSIGRSMDEEDRLKTAHTFESVRTGVSASWSNHNSGIHYTVTPTRTYTLKSEPCREYTVDAVIDNREEQTKGTACRQSDGRWEIQS